VYAVAHALIYNGNTVIFEFLTHANVEKSHIASGYLYRPAGAQEKRSLALLSQIFCCTKCFERSFGLRPARVSSPASVSSLTASPGPRSVFPALRPTQYGIYEIEDAIQKCHLQATSSVAPSRGHTRSFLGSDLSGGLLQFWHGKDLGEEGLRWLKIYMANFQGAGKANFVRFLFYPRPSSPRFS
jgi:hypothetical protein